MAAILLQIFQHMKAPKTMKIGGKNEDVYTVLDKGMERNVNNSPDEIREASAAQSGLIKAQAHKTAMKGLHLKCFDAVMAIKTGKKAKGVHDMKLSTANVLVVVMSGEKYYFAMINKPCNSPAAAKM